MSGVEQASRLETGRENSDKQPTSRNQRCECNIFLRGACYTWQHARHRHWERLALRLQLSAPIARHVGCLKKAIKMPPVCSIAGLIEAVH